MPVADHDTHGQVFDHDDGLGSVFAPFCGQLVQEVHALTADAAMRTSQSGRRLAPAAGTAWHVPAAPSATALGAGPWSLAWACVDSPAQRPCRPGRRVVVSLRSHSHAIGRRLGSRTRRFAPTRPLPTWPVLRMDVTLGLAHRKDARRHPPNPRPHAHGKWGSPRMWTLLSVCEAARRCG